MHAASDRTDVARGRAHLEALDEEVGACLVHLCWTVVDYIY